MLHIIAGRYKGRRLLPPPAGSATRPMTGAVKKSVFDLVSAWLEGSLVLDLYCGTGTLGLEALSRGAGHCCFADRDRGVLDRLGRNIDTLGVRGQATIWAGDIPRHIIDWLDRLDRPVDLMFVDPPYADARGWDWGRMTDRLFAPLAGHLERQGLLALRLPSAVHPPAELAGMRLKRTGGQGSMTMGYYQLPKAEG